VSAVTQIDVGGMAAAVRALMADAGLRARMGEAGRARARALFDWGAVVPQMQDLFAELDARRRAADPARFAALPATMLPVAPSPMTYLGGFPTAQLAQGARFVWRGGIVPVARALALRDYAVTRRVFEGPQDVVKVADALRERGSATAQEVAVATGFGILKTERCLMWLMKYDYAAEEAT
jgi:hypothetical protein